MNFFTNIFKPKEQTYTIVLTVTSPNGFHLRPIASFVNETKKYSEEITLSSKEQRVDAKSINAILALTLVAGDRIELCVVGQEPQKTLYTLANFFEELMQTELQKYQLADIELDNNIIETAKIEKAIYSKQLLRGTSIYEGIVIAPLYRATLKIENKSNNLNFQEALQKSIQELDKLYESHKQSANASIYLAHKTLLEDQEIQNITTLDAFNIYIKKHIQSLQATSFDARRADYLDIQKLILAQLGQSSTLVLPDTPFILFADDLLPSEVAILAKSAVAGVVLKKSSLLSHSAILLKNFSITSVIIRDTIFPNDESILDASLGLLIPNPSQEDKDIAKDRIIKNQEIKHSADLKKFDKTINKNGKEVKILANITNLESAKEAKAQGADGVGLLRSEFIFQSKEPSLEEQTKVYRDIFKLFDTITIRTLDVGGDKELPYIKMAKEANPFLGIRGIRLFDSHPEILQTQMKAILRASKGKAIKIMFPMVSTPKEFINAKATTLRIAQKYKLKVDNVKFGIMIEVPSVIFQIDAFNDIVDFYSIGTNDLTQYLFAIERTHPTLHADPLSKVLFDVLELLYTKSTKPISICGEIASIPQASQRLLQIGFTSLSMAPAQIPLIKETIRNG